VTVLSGFLGAGKTTLLKKILRNPATITDPVTKKTRTRKIAVIVNDMGEVNLDASEIKASKLIEEDAQMVELHNGCICCTLRGDLLRTVKSLADEGAYDYLVIESSGISEPLPVAQTFVMDVEEPEGGGEEGGEGEEEPKEKKPKSQQTTPATEAYKSLSNFARLDTLCTVVDATAIYDVLDTVEELSDPNNMSGMGASGDDDERPISRLLLDQIEFANVIILSKAQDVISTTNGATRVKEMTMLLKKLNPLARVVVSKKAGYADVDTEEHLINTGMFDMEKAESLEAWIEELELGNQHTPETEE
jgi:G3E family GTPase